MDEYLVGHKLCKIDAKGRVSIPANMRSALGDSFIASRGFGQCLALYPMDEWKLFMEKVHTVVNQKKRKQLEFYFTANAEKMSLDKQGRLLLNDNLREQVSLLTVDEAEVFGNNTRIEIWNSQLFNEQFEGIDADTVEDILDEAGI